MDIFLNISYNAKRIAVWTKLKDNMLLCGISV